MVSIWDGVSGIAKRAADISNTSTLNDKVIDDVASNEMVDSIEGGIAKICINPAILKPSRYKKQWEKHYFTKSLCGKKFTLYKDNSARDFVLSAWIVNRNEIRISQYENDCNNIYNEHEDKYIFVLRRDDLDSPLKLFTTRECEMCDGILGLGCCTTNYLNRDSPDASSNNASNNGSNNNKYNQTTEGRQTLCIINHSVVPIFRNCTNSRRDGDSSHGEHDARIMNIQLPNFHGNYDRRDCWCERGKRMKELRKAEQEKLKHDYAYSMYYNNHDDIDTKNTNVSSIIGQRRNSKTSNSSLSDDDSCSTVSDDTSKHYDKYDVRQHKTFQCNELTPIKLACKVPRWNQKVASLVMDFEGNRVKLASSKNFLMYIRGEKERKDKASPILQVGKCKSKRYNLDIKEPLSTVQGFAIALSGFLWKKENEICNKRKKNRSHT
jgi:hypothetical protein